MIIGVFDSGVGGQSVAHAIQKAFPDLKVLLREDKTNLPYGSKTIDELRQLVVPILQDMAREGCGVIVIACNTVSTNLIEELRRVISIPLIAIEPMIKPASEMTKSGVIAVCATPRTLSSKRYAYLKETYASGLKVIEPDCSDWAAMIEHSALEKTKIRRVIYDALAQGADVIVLGCTHYHWIEKEIGQLCAGKAAVIQPEQAILSRLRQLQI